MKYMTMLLITGAVLITASFFLTNSQITYFIVYISLGAFSCMFGYSYLGFKKSKIKYTNDETPDLGVGVTYTGSEARAQASWGILGSLIGFVALVLFGTNFLSSNALLKVCLALLFTIIGILLSPVLYRILIKK